MPYMTNRVKQAVAEFRGAFGRDPKGVYLSAEAFAMYTEENTPQPGEMSNGFQGHTVGVEVRPFNEAPSQDEVSLQVEADPKTDMVTVG